MKNREIKFRAWIKTAQSIADWETIKSQCDRLSIFADENFIFMQYTGLKDKNGKEGYHKDIIDHPVYGKGVIEWHLNGWAIHFDGMYGDEGWIEFEIIEESKIIGDLYKDPELLKE